MSLSSPLGFHWSCDPKFARFSIISLKLFNDLNNCTPSCFAVAFLCMVTALDGLRTIYGKTCVWQIHSAEKWPLKKIHLQLLDSQRRPVKINELIFLHGTLCSLFCDVHHAISAQENQEDVDTNVHSLIRFKFWQCFNKFINKKRMGPLWKP